MVPPHMLVRLDSLIDDLLKEGDLSASSLASILIAARDSLQEGYHVALARRVWDAGHVLRDNHAETVTTASMALDLAAFD